MSQILLKDIIEESPNILRQHIQNVGNMPEWFLQDTGAIFGSDLWTLPVKKTIDDYIERYKAIKYWLLCFHLGEPLHPFFSHPDNFDYIPFGELSHATLKLALQLFPRSSNAMAHFKNAGHMWGIVEHSSFRKAVCSTGLGEVLGIKELSQEPMLIGKTELLSSRATFKTDEGLIGGAMSTWFKQEAQAIANDDFYFRENYYQEYLKALSRFKQAMKNNEKFQITYFLSKDETFETAKGKAMPTQNAKSKGFGKRKRKDKDRGERGNVK